MSDVHTEFDNLSGLNDAKYFEQSNDVEPGIFDVPKAFQEFDKIEHEIDRSNQSFDEISLFSNKLKHSRVIRRDDALALESIMGKLENMPHLNSYTTEYTKVNYTITQESIFGKITSVLGDILSSIWNFILNTMSNMAAYVKGLFNKNRYSQATAQNAVIKKQVVVNNIVTTNPTAPPVSNSKTLTPEQKDIHNDRINRELRNLLYPKFSELSVLSLGGEINGSLLIDEMCEQRFKSFYTKFYNALYHKESTLLDYGNFTASFLTREVGSLSEETLKFILSDLTVPTPEKYINRYFTVDERIKEFVKVYSNTNTLHVKTLKANTNEFKVYTILAYEVASEITSLTSVMEMPESRTLLNLDLKWIFDIDKITVDIITDIEVNYKKLKKLNLTKDGSVHVDNKDSIRNMYSDWFILNKTMLVNAMFYTRLNSTISNFEMLMDYIIKTNKILTQ